MINVNGVEYPIKEITGVQRAYWQYIVNLELSKIYDPLVEFLKGIPLEHQQPAIMGFYSSRQNLDYPEYAKMMAENSMTSVKLLVEMLIPDGPVVTEENRFGILQQILIWVHDPELARILEMKRSRNATPTTTAG